MTVIGRVLSRQHRIRAGHRLRAVDQRALQRADRIGGETRSEFETIRKLLGALAANSANRKPILVVPPGAIRPFALLLGIFVNPKNRIVATM
jgi:hypothetical protein